MIGIGTDIVSITRIANLHLKYGERFAKKILSSDELSEYRKKSPAISFMAKRFAAKEALVKALGTGFSLGIIFSDITILHNDQGKPDFKLQGKVAEIARELGINNIALSISDEKEYALAFVVCE